MFVCHAHISIHKPLHNSASLSRATVHNKQLGWGVFHHSMKCHLFRKAELVFKESQHWDEDACSCCQPGTQSELPHFTAHAAQMHQLLFLRQEVKRGERKPELLMLTLSQHRQKPCPTIAASSRSPSNVKNARFSARVCFKNSFHKMKWKPWTSWHCLMKSCNCTSQQTYCHTILESSVLKASAFCMLQVWGCQHTHPTPCQGSAADLHSSNSTSHGSSSLSELWNTFMALCQAAHPSLKWHNFNP